MPVKAGPAPWNDYSAVSQYTKTGRRRSVITDGEMEWDLSTGWHLKREKGWRRHNENRTSKTITGLDGKKYKIYSYGGYDDYLGFHAQENTSDSNLQEKLAYAQNAFDTKNPDHGQIYIENGCGHISKIEYAAREQVLRVTFTNNGSICIFFRVPTAVAGELLHFAKTKQTQGYFVDGPKRGEPRHVLGVRFWDLVRIRGMQHGARYPFEYEKHSDGSLIKHSNGRYTVKLTAENARAIFGDNFQKLPGFSARKDIKAGEEFSVVLNEEDFAKVADELNNLVKGEGSSGWYLQGHGSASDFEGITADENESYRSDSVGARGSNELAKLASLAMDKAENELTKWKHSDIIAMLESSYDSELMSGTKLRKKVLDEYSDLYGQNVIQDIYNTRTGQIRNLNSYRKLQEALRSLAGNGQLQTWVKQNLPEYYQLRFTGRVWTPKELKEFANPNVEGNIEMRHAGTYKKFVAAEDWEGALNFLKSHKTTLHYVDKYGRSKILNNKTYAGQYDQVGTEE